MKQHYAGLDGLRGVAAIAVMSMHEIGIFRPGIGPAIHAYVAVDLFFMLSGFVLAFAYDDRFRRGMPWREFMVIRIIRLHPMLVVAVVLAVLVAGLKLAVQKVSLPDEALYLAPAGLLMLPVGWFIGHPTAFTSLFALIPFAGPGWSLLFEYIGSGVFATRWTQTAKLAVPIFLIASVALIVLTLSAGNIGLLGREGYIGVPAGLFRVGVPFAIGLFLFRHNIADRLPRVPVLLSVIVGGALCCLPLGDAPLYDLACVFILFPPLIAFGAQPPSSPFWHRTFALLGALSYPLYLLHVPVSRMVGFAAKTAMPSLSANALIVVSMIGSVACSFLALYLFDEPVRRWLASKLRRRTPLAPTPPITGELPFEQHAGVAGLTDQA